MGAMESAIQTERGDGEPLKRFKGPCLFRSHPHKWGVLMRGDNFWLHFHRFAWPGLNDFHLRMAFADFGFEPIA